MQSNQKRNTTLLEIASKNEKFIKNEKMNFLYPSVHSMTDQIRWFKGSRDRDLRSDIEA